MSAWRSDTRLCGRRSRSIGRARGSTRCIASCGWLPRLFSACSGRRSITGSASRPGRFLCRPRRCSMLCRCSVTRSPDLEPLCARVALGGAVLSCACTRAVLTLRRACWVRTQGPAYSVTWTSRGHSAPARSLSTWLSTACASSCFMRSCAPIPLLLSYPLVPSHFLPLVLIPSPIIPSHPISSHLLPRSHLLPSHLVPSHLLPSPHILLLLRISSHLTPPLIPSHLRFEATYPLHLAEQFYRRLSQKMGSCADRASPDTDEIEGSTSELAAKLAGMRRLETHFLWAKRYVWASWHGFPLTWALGASGLVDGSTRESLYSVCDAFAKFLPVSLYLSMLDTRY
jgi:hypothetical protein